MTFKDKILVIADLHLQSAEPDTLALALSFFEQARGAQHLYILGDLFEYWLGDDCLSDQAHPDHVPPGQAHSDNIHSGPSADTVASVITGLSALSQSGTPITLMHGNRDFLLGEAFADKIGATLDRNDVLALAQLGIVLMHGDTLCTDDVEYQQFRMLVRDTNWQSTFLAKPVIEREAIATALRSGSKDASQQKTMAIMDVNADAVEQVFKQFGCQYLIHGHTHRPAIHQVDTQQQQVATRQNAATRVVVGDWHADHAMVGVVALHGDNHAGVEIELLRYTQDFVSGSGSA